MKTTTIPELTKEWVDLVQEAMKSNVTKEEFREFLQKEKGKRREVTIPSDN